MYELRNAHLSLCSSVVEQRSAKSESLRSERSESLIPHGDSEFFSLSHARDKTKNIFLMCKVCF